MDRSERDRRLVLVVDREPALCLAMARHLQRDFAPIAATTAEEALEVIDRQPALVAVVTDYRLDDAHSREILERARAVRPRAARIVVSAALDDSLVTVLSVSRLAHRCVAKPWDPAALLDVVRAAVSERTSPTEDPWLASGTGRPTAEVPAELEPRGAAYGQPRRHPRYPTTLKVLVRLPTRTEFSDAHTMNLSRGGMMCQMNDAPQIGDEIDLIAQLPGGDRIRLRSTVRHVIPVAPDASEPAYRVGMQFQSLDDTRDRLLAMAISRLTGDV